MKRSHSLVYSSLCLALCLLLPLLTGQLRELGNALCPMHIPVLICGFICGPFWAMGVGFCAPLLRSLIFKMPAFYPMAIAMSFELLTYGLVCGLLYRRLPKKPWAVYLSLISAMVAGRAVWGAVRALISGLGGVPFTFAAFLAGGFTTALPGIVLHIVLIPAVVFALKRAGIIRE